MRADEAFVARNDAQDDYERPTREDAFIAAWLASRKAALEEAAKNLHRGKFITDGAWMAQQNAILALANRPGEG